MLKFFISIFLLLSVHSINSMGRQSLLSDLYGSPPIGEVDPFLHEACKEGKLKIVKVLVKRGFDLKEKNGDGHLAFQLAKTKRLKRFVIQYLIDEIVAQNAECLSCCYEAQYFRKKNITITPCCGEFICQRCRAKKLTRCPKCKAIDGV